MKYPPYPQWYANLPTQIEHRVMAILKRYEGDSPYGVADTVFEALCPGSDVLGVLEDMREEGVLSYVTGRVEWATHPGMRYWKAKEKR